MAKKQKRSKKSTEPCIVCGKNTLTVNGWHLKDNLNFCSNACVAKCIEAYEDKLKELGRRISKLERTLLQMKKA